MLQTIAERKTPAFERQFSITANSRLQNADSCDIELYGKRTDGTITAQPPIKAHKLLLSSASARLREAFSSSHKPPPKKSKLSALTIAEIDHDNLQIMVNFIYTGKLRFDGGKVEERLKSILIGADYLGMPDAVTACEEALMDCMRNEYAFRKNYLEIWLLAKKCRCDEWATRIVQKLRDESLYYIQTEDSFLRLSYDDVVTFLKDFIEAEFHRRYRGAIDFDVCDAAAAWFAHDKSGRSGVAGKLLLALPIDKISLSAWQKALNTLSKFVSEKILAEIRLKLAARMRSNETAASLRVELEQLSEQYEQKRKELVRKIGESECLAEPSKKSRYALDSDRSSEDDDEEEQNEDEGDEDDYEDEY